MKKIISALFVSVIALLAVSCYPEDLTVFDTSKATAPVLGSYEIGPKAISASYTAGSFNQNFNTKIQPNHFFVLSSADGKKVSRAVTTSDKDGVLSASITSLANALVALGYKEGDIVNFELKVRASMQTNALDNGRNGYVDSEGSISVSGFEVVFPKGSPYQEYTKTSPFSVIGALSAYEISWDGDLEMWMTEDEQLHVAKCVTLKAGDEFKFRKDLDWGVNYGGDFGTFDSPFSVSQDGPNIKVSQDGVYDLWLDLTAGTATVTEAYQAYPDHKEASNWSVIGSLSEYGISWDGDITMLTDGTTHVAQGVKLAAADEFKFRQDKDWAVNLGGEYGSLGSDFSVTQDGPNIKVGADGVYDLIVNPAAGTAQIVETLGGGVSGKIGGDEPEPGPEPVVIDNAWSIIGGVEGSNWDKDFYMTEADGIWTSDPLSFEAGAQFKLRFNNSWADEDCIGAAEADFVAPVGTAFTGAHPGANISIQDAGVYQIVLDPATLSITINTMANKYSLIGELNGTSWDKDFFMTQDGDVWTYGPISVSGGFKVRFNQSWADADTYGTADGFEVVIGEAFEAVQPGGNISVPEGDYIIVFNAADKTITVNPALPANTWSVIGSVSGTSWDKDFYMTDNNGVWVSDALEFTGDSEFKIRFDNSWADENTVGGGEGGIQLTPGVPVAAVHPGSNLKVATPGTYRVVFDTNRQIIYLQGWALIGNVAGSSWDKDFLMSVGSDGRWYSDPVQITGEFKLRFNASWADADTRGAKESGFSFTPLTPFEVEGPGNNINVPASGYYTVAFDAEKNEVTIYRSEWALIGNVGGTSWNRDFFMVEYEAGVYTSAAVAITGEFKIRRNASWADEDTRGYGEPGFSFASGEAFTVTGPGNNINVPESATYVVKYTPASESVVITKQ